MHKIPAKVPIVLGESSCSGNAAFVGSPDQDLNLLSPQKVPARDGNTIGLTVASQNGLYSEIKK